MCAKSSAAAAEKDRVSQSKITAHRAKTAKLSRVPRNAENAEDRENRCGNEPREREDVALKRADRQQSSAAAEAPERKVRDDQDQRE